MMEYVANFNEFPCETIKSLPFPAPLTNRAIRDYSASRLRRAYEEDAAGNEDKDKL
jgi:hypothetical protein